MRHLPIFPSFNLEDVIGTADSVDISLVAWTTRMLSDDEPEVLGRKRSERKTTLGASEQRLCGL